MSSYASAGRRRRPNQATIAARNAAASTDDMLLRNLRQCRVNITGIAEGDISPQYWGMPKAKENDRMRFRFLEAEAARRGLTEE